MTIKVRVYADKIDLADELEEAFHEEAKAGLAEAADLVLADIKRRLRLRRGPEAVPEGEPPAYQQGKLERSYKRIAPKIRGRVASSGVYSRDPGANRLEFGAIDSRGIRTLPHPHVRPAFDAKEAEVDALLQQRLGGTTT